MSNGDRPMGTGGGRMQAQIRVNLNELPPVSCPACKCQIFATNIAIYKKLGATQSPTGKAMLAMISLLLCQDCGALSQVVQDELKLVEVEKITPPEDGKEDKP